MIRIGPAALALAVALIVAASAPAQAIDTTSLRSLDLRRSLQDVRTDLHRRPARADYELERARRRLHDLRIEAPRDPRLWRLERDLARLEAEADRYQRRRAIRADLRRLEAGRERLPTPEFLRAPYATDLRGDQLPIGTGKLFVLIQNSLRDGDRRLRLGDAAAARRHLRAAEADLVRLKAELPDGASAQDPQIVAAERQIADLRARLEDAG